MTARESLAEVIAEHGAVVLAVAPHGSRWLICAHRPGSGEYIATLATAPFRRKRDAVAEQRRLQRLVGSIVLARLPRRPISKLFEPPTPTDKNAALRAAAGFIRPRSGVATYRLAHKLRDPEFYTARTKRAVNSGGAL